MVQQIFYGFFSFFLVISSVNGDIIILSSGEQLTVEIVEHAEAHIHVRHAILGDFSIASKDVTSIQGKDIPATSTDVAAQEKLVEVIAPKWNQSLSVSLGIQRGQRDSADYATAYHADKTENEHKITVDMRYRGAESDGERTANRFTGELGNAWSQENSKWGVFTTLQFDWAEFQSWDQRLVGDIGVAYKLIKKQQGNESFSLSVRLGSGFRKEFQSESDDWIPEGLLGTSIAWSISEKQTLTAGTTWYPDYEDVSNYRLVTNASWNIEMDNIKNLQFSVGLRHEYDSVVDTGVDKTYLHITAGIKYSF
jgi:hypothetical protein